MKHRQRGLERGAAVICLIGLGLAASATPGVGPQPLPLPPPVPAPRDIPFNGTILLKVDATDIAHKTMSVHEVIPVQAAGPVTASVKANTHCA